MRATAHARHLLAIAVIIGVCSSSTRTGAATATEMKEKKTRVEAAAVMLADVKKGKGTYGYNAATGVHRDMLDMGILDPTKVTRLALQNAASVASLLLTTEAMVAEVPKGDEHIALALLENRGGCAASENGGAHRAPGAAGAARAAQHSTGIGGRAIRHGAR